MDSQLGSTRRRPSKRVSNNSNKPLGPAVARPIRSVQARREFFLVEQLAHPIFWASRSATVPPIKKFSPAIIFDAAFEGGQSVGPAFDQLRLSLLTPKNGTHTLTRKPCVFHESWQAAAAPSKHWTQATRECAEPTQPKNVKHARIPAATSAGSNAEFLDLMHPLCG